MKPLATAPHLLAAWRQLGHAGRVQLLRHVLAAAVDRLRSAGAIPHDFDDGSLDHHVVVALCVRDAQLRPVADLVRLCVRGLDALDAAEPADDIAAHVALAHAALDPDLELARRVRHRLPKPGERRTIYEPRVPAADKKARAQRVLALTAAGKTAAEIAKAERCGVRTVERIRSDNRR